jgi:hypothetical protein
MKFHEQRPWFRALRRRVPHGERAKQPIGQSRQPTRSKKEGAIEHSSATSTSTRSTTTPMGAPIAHARRAWRPDAPTKCPSRDLTPPRVPPLRARSTRRFPDGLVADGPSLQA